MQKRKSHTKSRNGCQNCKKRHVKCDEQGPPCLNCIVRKESNCTFPFLRSSGIHHTTSTSLLAPIPSPVVTPSPCAFSSTPDGNRLLELELMHRWSTRSWTCQASIPRCKGYLLEVLPRAALRNSYLLNAILATAAIDLALCYSDKSSVDSGAYFRAALEYGTRATGDFRAQVTSLNPENIDLVFYFSSLVGVVNFAMPPDTNMSIIDRVCDYTDMALKSGRIAFENVEWLIASPSPVGVILREFGANLGFLDDLDPQTQAALELLSEVSQRVRIPVGSPAIAASVALTGSPLPSDQDDELDKEQSHQDDRYDHDQNRQSTDKGPFAADLYIYKLAIGQTKYCFAEDLQDRLKGYFHTVFAVAGATFTTAIRDREPMALFLLMYWGVLVQRATRDPALWAIVSEGRDVVAEASGLLMQSDIRDVPGVREGIAWTRSQVGLAPWEGCELPARLTESGIVEGEVVELWGEGLNGDS